MWGRKGSKPSAKWSIALQNAVLIFSDLQVVTGISILVSGYSQLACGLATYRWLITVDLAWFSSVTHLTTLTCLRRYFQERPGLKVWRMVCMGVTAMLLGCALGTTGYLGGNGSTGAIVPLTFPAWCLYHPDLMSKYSNRSNIFPPTYDHLDVAIAMIILSVSYLTRFVRMLPSVSNGIPKPFRTRLSNILKGWLNIQGARFLRSSARWNKTLWSLAHIFVLSIYCMLEAAAGLYGSMLWEVSKIKSGLIRRKH